MQNNWEKLSSNTATLEEKRKIENEKKKLEEQKYEKLETYCFHDAMVGKDYLWGEEEKKHLAMTGWEFMGVDVKGYTAEEKPELKVTTHPDGSFSVKESEGKKASAGIKFNKYRREKAKIKDSKRLAEIEKELGETRSKLKSLTDIPPMLDTLWGKVLANSLVGLIMLILIIPFPIWLVYKVYSYKKLKKECIKDFELIKAYNEKIAEIEKELADVGDFSNFAKEEQAKNKRKNISILLKRSILLIIGWLIVIPILVMMF